MDHLPKLADELVIELAKMFPAPEVKPETLRDRLMFEAGAREVVEKLLELRKRALR